MDKTVPLLASGSIVGGITTLRVSPFPEPPSAWTAAGGAALGALTAIESVKLRPKGIAGIAAMAIQATTLIIHATLPAF